MLQIISDVREPLEERVNPDDEGGPSNLKEMKLQFQSKLDQKKEELEQFAQLDEYDEDKFNSVIAKTKLYASIVEEINLKEKLTLKRSLNLCLILLK